MALLEATCRASPHWLSGDRLQGPSDGHSLPDSKVMTCLGPVSSRFLYTSFGHSPPGCHDINDTLPKVKDFLYFLTARLSISFPRVPGPSGVPSFPHDKGMVSFLCSRNTTTVHVWSSTKYHNCFLGHLHRVSGTLQVIAFSFPEAVIVERLWKL